MLKNIVIAAGGTGGHLYPAIALAKEFQKQQQETIITFVGSGKNLENSILAHEGFAVAHIDVKGMVGRGVWGGAAKYFPASKSDLAVDQNSSSSFGSIGHWDGWLF